MRKKRDLALAGLMVLSILGLTVGCGNSKDKNVNSNVESNSNIESNLNVESNSNIESNLNVESNITSNSNTTQKVYSDNEIISKAINYVKVTSDVKSKLDARIEAKNGYKVSIRVYEDLEDHVATLGIYTIDSRTLIGVNDIMDTKVDLKNPVRKTSTKVYSDSEIINKAINYVKVTNGVDIKLSARIESKDGYNVSIRVYEDMEDHVATLGLYTIDSRTLKGENDLYDAKVDLNNPVRKTSVKVYSDSEIINKAINYVKKSDNVNSKIAARIEYKEGYEVSIRVYEDMEDHVATLGLYTIDSRTLKGVDDILDKKVDLNSPAK